MHEPLCLWMARILSGVYLPLDDPFDFPWTLSLLLYPHQFMTRLKLQYDIFSPLPLASARPHLGLVPPKLSNDHVVNTNTVSVHTLVNPVPWYHSSISFQNVVSYCQPKWVSAQNFFGREAGCLQTSHLCSYLIRHTTYIICMDCTHLELHWSR